MATRDFDNGRARALRHQSAKAAEAAAATRVVVTLGARGAALLGSDGAVRRIPAPTITAVDTSGVGDAFVGGFAYGLAIGLDEVAAVTLGIRCASDSVQRLGTQRSFPDRDRARSFLTGI